MSTLDTVTSKEDSTQTDVYPKLTWENMKMVKYEETKLVCLERFWQKKALQLPAKGKKSTCEGIQGEQSYSSTCSKFDTRCK